MNLHEYTQLLLKGYHENSDNLAKYLIRESKKAEKEYIDNEEFFEGLNKVINLFKNDIDNQYYKRKNDVSIIKSIREEKGQSIEDLKGQVFPRENYYVFLPRVTGNLFTGNLPYQDLLFLESEISRAQELISVEGTKKNEVEKLDKQIHKSDLSAFEIALRHWYLVKYKKEDWIEPVKVGKKYKDLRNYKNIEDHSRDIDSNRNRKPKQKELKNIENSLSDYPDIQKAIQNDIDKLN